MFKYGDKVEIEGYNQFYDGTVGIVVQITGGTDENPRSYKVLLPSGQSLDTLPAQYLTKVPRKKPGPLR